MLFEKQHLRHCLLFAFQLKKSAAEAQEMICSALGEGVISYTCKKWFQRFKSGNFDLNDRKCPGQPKKVNNEELEQLLEFLLHRNKARVTRQAISKRLHKLERIQKEGHWIPHWVPSQFRTSVDAMILTVIAISIQKEGFSAQDCDL